MARGGRARGRPRRRSPYRQPRELFLVCCEGKETEPGYFEHVRGRLRGALIKIVVHDKSDSDPLAVVRTAIAERDRAADLARRESDQNAAYDHVWAVVDVDQHARLSEAVMLAEKEGIVLAISNPCFELWPYLHFADQRAHIDGAALQTKLRQHMPGYGKHLDCSRLTGHYGDARRRARGLEAEHRRSGRQPDANPSTRVHALLEAVLEAAGRSAPNPESYRDRL